MEIWQLLLWSFTLSAAFEFARCDGYCISPFKNASNKSCVMLSNFADNSSSFSGENISLRLYLQPGIHILNVNLSLFEMHLFSMESVSSNPLDTIISCTMLVNLKFASISTVNLIGLGFKGCSPTEVTLTDNFRLQSCMYLAGNMLDLQPNGSALVLYDSIVYIQNTSISHFIGSKCSICPTKAQRSVPLKGVKVGGAIISVHCNISITNSVFHNNTAQNGGAIFAVFQTNITLFNSSFMNHSVYCRKGKCYGGVIYSNSSNLQVSQCIFSRNSNVRIHPSRSTYGGVFGSFNGNISVDGSHFDKNIAYIGGTLFFHHCTVKISRTTFLSNKATFIAGVASIKYSIVLLQYSFLINNTAVSNVAGAILIEISTLNATDVNFDNNSANFSVGGAIKCNERSKLMVARSNFTNNIASTGGAIYSIKAQTTIVNVSFENNRAHIGAAVCVTYGSISCQGSNMFYNNSGNLGVIAFFQINGSIMGRFTLKLNLGSILVIGSELCVGARKKSTFFIMNNKPKSNDIGSKTHEIQEGGGLTSILSTIKLMGKIAFKNNNATNGGGILAVSSRIVISSKNAKVSNNYAENTGGGIYLYQTKLVVEGNVELFKNVAKVSGGGLHSVSSLVILRLVYNNINKKKPFSYLLFKFNSAERGGGACLELNSKFYITTQVKAIKFISNSADYGGAMYITDETNKGTCSSNTQTIAAATESECFFQSISAATDDHPLNIEEHTLFNNNFANSAGSVLFGGLLDRCTLNTMSSSKLNRSVTVNFIRQKYSNQPNFINNLLNETASKAVRICFCHNHNVDCSYQQRPIQVMKGELFSIRAVAVDHVNHTVSTTVHSYLSHKKSTLGRGQQIQISNATCTELTFRVYTEIERELLTLYAEGPCGDVKLSQRQLVVILLPCKCAVGFQPLESEVTDCQCICDSQLNKYISNCNALTNLVQRTGDFWISSFHVNNQSYVYSYFIYPHCPFDYCHPSSVTVGIDLSTPNGTDAQCTHNRSGILCGFCKPGLTLSLGSSYCISCPRNWIVNFVTITVSAFVLGIILVFFILVLNMTVATGTLNGIIFYANILAANQAIFLPFPKPNFITVTLAWLNLDFGFDVCYVKGMDAYAKAWFELSFPVYIIVLVAVIIHICKYSTKFSSLIGKRNPVSTLATLILLSYAKLLQSIIMAMSYAVLNYPDGSYKVVWRPDATVRYIMGKHVFIFLTAIVVLLIGIAYTIILFSWQWLLRLSHMKPFKWTQNSKLTVFMDTYHAPYTPQQRYWTGLLLIARVILYLVSAVNVSGEPSIDLLAVLIVVSILLTLKYNIYKNWLVGVQETTFYINLIMFSGGKLYLLQTKEDDTVLAYVSTSIAIFMLLCIIVYHMVISTPVSFKTCLEQRIKKLLKRRICRVESHLATPLFDNNSHSSMTSINSSTQKVSYSVIQLSSLDSVEYN